MAVPISLGHGPGHYTLAFLLSVLFSATFMPRCRRLVIISVSTVLVCFAARPGSAEWAYRLSATGSAGVIENPRAQSSQSNSRVRGIASTEGRADLYHIGRLNRESLAYGIILSSWFPSGDSLYVTQTLRLSETLEASPVTRVGLSAGATLAQRSMLDATVPTNPQTAGPRPAGGDTYLGLDATETFTSQFAGSWQVEQGLSGRVYRSVGNQVNTSDNRGASFDLALARAWSRDSATSRARLEIMTSRSTAPAGQPVPADRTGETAQFQLGWRHVWTAEISHGVEAGAFVLRTDQTKVFPALSANLTWQSLGYLMELRAARSAQSNIFTGQVYVQNMVGLRCSLPLDRRELLRASADASAERDSIESPTLGTSSTATVMLGRLALAWQPGDIFTFGFQYTIRDQRVPDQNASAAGSNPNLLSSYRQQTAMLSVSMQYPPSSMAR